MNHSGNRTQPSAGSRLGTYLSLGLGTGLLGSQTADAQIVYFNSGPVTVTPGQTVWLNPVSGAAEAVAGDGGASFGSPQAGFFFNNSNYIYTQDSFMGFSVIDGSSSTLSKLAANATIGSATPWRTGFTYLDRPGWTSSDSAWATGADGTTGYIGLRFDPTTPGGSAFVYGWVRFTYDAASQELVLHDFAYESTVGAPILAGAGAAVPEPGSLGMSLVFGASGVLAARQFRKAKAKKAA